MKNIKKQYGDTAQHENFCLECSIEVPVGQITGLIGRNGAGKSTMFKAILGLIHIDSGSIEILGKNIETLTTKDREEIGVVLADSGFSGYLSIKDILPILNTMYSNFSKEKFVEGCKRLELPLDKKIKEFSTGMKRKLQILAALSHNAKLLVLDEPTAGLDVVARDTLLGMLREYMEDGERSIIISSHIATDLEGLCDDLYLIENGKIVLHEDTDVLLSDYGRIKATDEQFERLDKTYIIKCKREHFGYSCLTDKRQFYQDNYPTLAIERGSIDEVLLLFSNYVTN